MPHKKKSISRTKSGKRVSRGRKRNKRKSGRKRASRKRSASPTKMTWEKFLQNKDSRKVLQDAWKHKNPQKQFGQTVKRLHRKYSSNKAKR